MVAVPATTCFRPQQAKLVFFHRSELPAPGVAYNRSASRYTPLNLAPPRSRLPSSPFHFPRFSPRSISPPRPYRAFSPSSPSIHLAVSSSHLQPLHFHSTPTNLLLRLGAVFAVRWAHFRQDSEKSGDEYASNSAPVRHRHSLCRERRPSLPWTFLRIYPIFLVKPRSRFNAFGSAPAQPFLYRLLRPHPNSSLSRSVSPHACHVNVA
ncbi:hypothetical protein C8R45DRAFT_1173901, partial [Mycena sanguinolenta]